MSYSVPEAAALFLGWRYARQSASNRFPVIQGCLPSSLALKPTASRNARLIDCSSFVTAVLCYMHPDADWDAASYGDCQIFRADDLWSAPAAWERAGIGKPLPEGECARGWGVYQGWVDAKHSDEDGDPIEGGHQWLYHGGMGVRVHSSSLGDRGPVWEHVTWSSLVAKYSDGIRGVAL